MRDVVRFALDGQTHEVRNPDPTLTLLRYLRGELRRTGTKEGCAEGDCGACTVAIAGPDETPRAVNSCILFLPMLDGMTLWTVESLVGADGALHPIQQAMVDHHGSQCGFCTPGFVMAIYAHLASQGGTSTTEINDALAGNLCRCTGYGPIIAAAQSAGKIAAESHPPATTDDSLGIEHICVRTGLTKRFFAPRSLDELGALAEKYANATFLAGATDVGLWVTKQHRDLETLISVMHVPELRKLKDTTNGLEIGAAVRYAEAHAALAQIHPDLGELIRRLGAAQVRNAGTIGGNIANGSPIGDMPPALIAVDATLVLRKGATERKLPLEKFFLDYGKQDRAPGEIVARVLVPKLPAKALYGVHKISKRFDQDISAVCGAFRIVVENGKVADARLAYGGMAGVPKRAAHAEAALVGKDWNEASVRTAMTALAQDFSPLTDARGSAEYRLKTARNLLYRFWLENNGSATPTRLLQAGALDA